MEAQDLKDKAEDLTSHVGDYLDSFYKLTLLNVTEKGTSIAGAIMSMLAVCTLGVFAIVFIGIAGALWIGNRIESRVGGFLIAGGGFLLVTIIIILMRKKIIFPYLRNKIIRKVYE